MVSWAVAVTTAPRQECTLLSCLSSLFQAGWTRDELNIFAEPGSTLTCENTILHSERMGVWRNWVFSMTWLLENTESDLILSVQDDSLFHPDSRAFVDKCLWPHPKTGFISLYTPKHYSTVTGKTLRPVGVNRIVTHSLWGACALVFDRRYLAAKVIRHPIIDAWVGSSPKSGNRNVMMHRHANPHLIANSDTAIGKIVNRTGRTMWCIDPSPVTHISKFSSIPGHGSNEGKRNAFRIADHSIPLIDQIPLPKTLYELAPITP